MGRETDSPAVSFGQVRLGGDRATTACFDAGNRSAGRWRRGAGTTGTGVTSVCRRGAGGHDGDARGRPYGPPLPELTLGSYRPPEAGVRMEPTVAATRGATTDADLPAIEARCRLKAEGIRWAATRRRRMDEGAEFRVEIAPRDREILDRARDLDCYLWMNTPDFTVPREPSSLEDVAGCFECGGRCGGPGAGDAARPRSQPGVLRAGPRSACRGPVGVAGGDRPDRRAEGPRPVPGLRLAAWGGRTGANLHPPPHEAR